MYMVMFVLDQPDLLNRVLKAWEDVGITGATIVESSGFFRQKERRKLMTGRYILPTMQAGIEKGNLSIFSIVADEQQVQAALQAVETVTGDLNQPNTGVFSAWPLGIVKGLSGRNGPGGEA